MQATTGSASVIVIGGGVVGAAVLHALAHRGVDAILIEAEPDLALGASGTNSGLLHTGFDSEPGSLETELILRSAALRQEVLPTLGVPVLRAGAVLAPLREEDHETIYALAVNAAANGVDVRVREDDGALVVPGESVTDPVAYTHALARAARVLGALVVTGAEVVGIDDAAGRIAVRVASGDVYTADAVVNCAGLRADEVARMVGDDSFEIFPRKGEFFVFEPPSGGALDHVLLPVPTKRTKGVLVFPTTDGHVVAGPTAVDGTDKDDWSVRREAAAEVLGKAVDQWAPLAGLTPVASYAGLRPAGRDSNYVVGRASHTDRVVNVAAIRSTGLSASLGIAERVVEELRGLGIELGEQRPWTVVEAVAPGEPWWRRAAAHRAAPVSR